MYLVLMISGGSSPDCGKSVEVYVPSTGQHCQLEDLPARRYRHSMEKMMVCGGWNIDTMTSCLTLTDAGTWQRTTTLRDKR